MQPTLTVIIGPAGFGKSTLALKLQRENSTGTLMFIYEADQWMMEDDGKYKFDPTKLAYCHRMCQQNTELSLSDGHHVIVSNTTLRRKDLNVYLDIAERQNAKVRVIRMTKEYGSIHNVPPDKIEQMKHMMAEFDWKDLPDFVTVEDYDAPTPMVEMFDKCSS